MPYAAPPIGNLRFRAPQPHPGWAGVRSATAHGAECPQHLVAGSEDCLFLNIYTQDLIGTRPVMVFVHGGAFNSGSGDSSLYGPDYIVQDDVVLVTINYRLSIFGFLSTGDSHAQGNYGLKDIIQALRWIQADIARFGGDPNNVTLFGHSAGAAAVQYLVLSQTTAGLYHKAVFQSGSVLNPWAFQPDPRSVAFGLAAELGITTTSTEQLVNQLRSLSTAQLVARIPILPDNWLIRPLEYGPSIEAADSLEPRLLTVPPLQMMMSGQSNRMPIMTGFTDAEALVTLTDPVPADSDSLLIPLLWNIPPGSPDGAEIANSFRNFYWNGGPLSEAVRFNYMEVIRL